MEVIASTVEAVSTTGQGSVREVRPYAFTQSLNRALLDGIIPGNIRDLEWEQEPLPDDIWKSLQSVEPPVRRFIGRLLRQRWGVEEELNPAASDKGQAEFNDLVNEQTVASLSEWASECWELTRTAALSRCALDASLDDRAKALMCTKPVLADPELLRRLGGAAQDERAMDIARALLRLAQRALRIWHVRHLGDYKHLLECYSMKIRSVDNQFQQITSAPLMQLTNSFGVLNHVALPNAPGRVHILGFDEDIVSYGFLHNLGTVLKAWLRAMLSAPQKAGCLVKQLEYIKKCTGISVQNFLDKSGNTSTSLKTGEAMALFAWFGASGRPFIDPELTVLNPRLKIAGLLFDQVMPLIVLSRIPFFGTKEECISSFPTLVPLLFAVDSLLRAATHGNAFTCSIDYLRNTLPFEVVRALELRFAPKDLLSEHLVEAFHPLIFSFLPAQALGGAGGARRAIANAMSSNQETSARMCRTRGRRQQEAEKASAKRRFNSQRKLFELSGRKLPVAGAGLMLNECKFGELFSKVGGDMSDGDCEGLTLGAEIMPQDDASNGRGGPSGVYNDIERSTLGSVEGEAADGVMAQEGSGSEGEHTEDEYSDFQETSELPHDALVVDAQIEAADEDDVACDAESDAESDQGSAESTSDGESDTDYR